MEALEGMCVRGSAVSSILTATCASWQKYTRVIHTGNTPTELTHQLCHLVLWLNSWAQSFCMSFHTGWPTPAPTHCCPCKSYPLLSLQLDQETEAFLADHTHCCPHSLIRKQKPSLQIQVSLACAIQTLQLLVLLMFPFILHWSDSETCIHFWPSLSPWYDLRDWQGVTNQSNRLSQVCYFESFSVHNIYKHASTRTHTHTHTLSLSSSAY